MSDEKIAIGFEERTQDYDALDHLNHSGRHVTSRTIISLSRNLKIYEFKMFPT